MPEDVLPPISPAAHPPGECWALCGPECTADPPTPPQPEIPSPRAAPAFA